MTYLRPLGTVRQCSEVILIKRSVKTAHWALQNTRLRVILAFLKYRWASARAPSGGRVWDRVWGMVCCRVWSRVQGSTHGFFLDKSPISKESSLGTGHQLKRFLVGPREWMVGLFLMRSRK